MTTSLKYQIGKMNAKTWGPILLLSVPGLIAIPNLMHYFTLDLNLILCFMSIPMLLVRRESRKGHLLGYLSIALFILYFIYHLQTVFFFAICALFLYLIEKVYGKQSRLFYCLIFLSTPIFKYIVKVFGFPIRLKITEFATQILQLIRPDMLVDGNIITLDGIDFSVDTACIGLNMFITSFIILILLIAFFQQQSKKVITLPWVGLLLSINLLLNLLSNLCRVVILILFKSMPETFSHEMYGLISFFLYNLLPMYFITKLVVQEFGKQELIKEQNQNNYSLITKIIYGLSIGCISYTMLNAGEIKRKEFDASFKELQLNDYTKRMMESGVVSFTNEQAIIYIKPFNQFYSSDHTPLICWKGSGYKVKNQKIRNSGNKKVFTATLLKKEAILYTIWYYDSGNKQTLSQLNWRWNNFRYNDRYRLVNITCNTKEKALEIANNLQLNFL